MIKDVVSKLVVGVRKQKGSLISLFTYHLYKHEGLLKSEEENNWNIQEALLKYREVDMEMDSKIDKDR